MYTTVGIDVGKDSSDIYIYETDKHWQVNNSLAGVQQLLAQPDGIS